MSQCTEQCCPPLEIFEDQDFAKTRQCSHCEGVPIASKRDTNGKVHCGSCSCEVDIDPNDKEEQMVISQASVTCRIHPDCHWWDCFSLYANHVQPQANSQNLFTGSQSELDGNLTLSFNSAQKILSLPKVEDSQSKASTQNSGGELLTLQAAVADITERLKNLMNRLTTESEMKIALTILENFTLRLVQKIDLLPKAGDVSHLLSKDFLTNSQLNLLTWNETDVKQSMVKKLTDDLPNTMTSTDMLLMTNVQDAPIQPIKEQNAQENPVAIFGPTITTRSQIAEFMKTPIKWNKDFRSELLYKYSNQNWISKSFCFNMRIMKHSLQDFGLRKKFKGRNTNNDMIGLCLRGPEFSQSDDPKAVKIGTEIWKVKFKDPESMYYADTSKVKEDLRTGYRRGATEFVVEFDVKTRTLTVSDYLNGDSQKILVVKILEEVDLAKVHLYFGILTMGCNERLNLLGYDELKFQVTEVEFEYHDQTLIRNKYNSIVKVKDEGSYCWLLDTPLIPFKRYKFECSKWDPKDTYKSINGLGIFKKDRIASNNYRFNLVKGYEANCGMIAIDCNGNIMHDNQKNPNANGSPNFLIGHFDHVVLEYDSNEQKVTLHNLKTDKRLILSYSIDIAKIDEYYVGGFLGNGFGNVTIV
jgi:hypothetical protein